MKDLRDLSRSAQMRAEEDELKNALYILQLVLLEISA